MAGCGEFSDSYEDDRAGPDSAGSDAYNNGGRDADADADGRGDGRRGRLGRSFGVVAYQSKTNGRSGISVVMYQHDLTLHRPGSPCGLIG